MKAPTPGPWSSRPKYHGLGRSTQVNLDAALRKAKAYLNRGGERTPELVAYLDAWFDFQAALRYVETMRELPETKVAQVPPAVQR